MVAREEIIAKQEIIRLQVQGKTKKEPRYMDGPKYLNDTLDISMEQILDEKVEIIKETK